MALTLVLLAAGLGSRYGARKQAEPVGPSGASLPEYTAFDALHAGFGRIVFVLDPGFAATFEKTIGARIGSCASVGYALQRLEDLPGDRTPPPERSKPWGTGQALLAARGLVDGPFAVANADDFYGRDRLRRLAAALSEPGPEGPPEYLLAAFQLRDVLSDAGPVNRGACEVDADGWLRHIEEIIGLEAREGGALYRDERGQVRALSGDHPICMNLWGFTSTAFPQLEALFEGFLARHGDSPDAEFYLTDAVQDLLAAGTAKVRVMEGAGPWYGLTHREDTDRLREALADLVRGGAYPRDLWA